MRRGVLVLLLCYIVGSEEDEHFRLPQHVIPTHYRLDIITYLQGNFSFHGKVWIDIEVKQITDNITLHKKDLHIDQISTKLVLIHDLNDDLGNRTAESLNLVEDQIQVKTHVEDDSTDFLILQLATSLQPGQRYRLHLSYKGTLADNLTGYYRLSYRLDNSSELRWMAATVFEPVEARRAFPCFDEPAFKATFQLNLARSENVVTIANMPINMTEPMLDKPGWEWDHFDKSPPMSSYLVAFVVGQLGFREITSEDGKIFRVWARPEAVSHSQYALNIAPRIVQHLTEYIGLSDPLPKTDLVGLPGFISDALENWGVISFGECYLLYESGMTSTSTREYITTIIAHELAHSWFGNLVTLRWWDSIWLNEGFATYFSTIAVEKVDPDAEIHSSAAVDAFLKVFSSDALHSSHALTTTINKKSELYQIFDDLTYYKGYYLLRMLNHTLGETTFRSAIARYVETNQYKNVEECDFWTALTERMEDTYLPQGLNIKSLMNTWTSQPGYPVVTVNRNYTTGTARLTQARFLRAKGDVELRMLEKEDTGWWIPLTFTSQNQFLQENSTQLQLWLDPGQSHTLLQDLPGEDEWLLFNVRAAALYRVNYDSQNWLLLADFLDSDQYQKIPVENRALLLDDAMDLARADMLPYSVAFNVSRYLSHEHHYLPWKVALKNIDYVSRMLRTTDSSTPFQRFMIRLLSPQFKEIGFEPQPNERTAQKLHRKQIVKWACSIGHQDCVDHARAHFSMWQKSNGTTNTVPVDLRSVVYCTSIAQGSQEEWDYLWKRYKLYNRSSDRSGILSALGCSQDTEVLKRYLLWSIQPNSGIKKQSSAAVFKAVAKNPIGNPVAKEFLKENIEKIQFYIGPNPFHLPKLLTALAYQMNQPGQLKELQEFQMQHMTSLRSAVRSVEQANEMVQFNIDWLQLHYSTIEQWLQTDAELTPGP